MEQERRDIIAKALAEDPNVRAEDLAERLGWPLRQVATSLGARRYWTPERKVEVARQNRARTIPIGKLGPMAAVSRAIQDGIMVRPSECSVCGASGVAIEGHHHDYSKTLEVVWVCRPCHGAADRIRRLGEPFDANVVRVMAKARTAERKKQRERK